MSAREPGAWDGEMGADREEAHYEDLCEYARAVLDNPDHKHRDDFGGYARETIGGLLKWIERLESRLSISCQRNMAWRAELTERAIAAEARAERMRTALLGLVGESDPETLRTMAAVLKAAGRHAEANACAALAGEPK